MKSQLILSVSNGIWRVIKQGSYKKNIELFLSFKSSGSLSNSPRLFIFPSGWCWTSPEIYTGLKLTIFVILCLFFRCLWGLTLTTYFCLWCRKPVYTEFEHVVDWISSVNHSFVSYLVSWSVPPTRRILEDYLDSCSVRTNFGSAKG